MIPESTFLELAEQYDCPLYVYDSEKIREQYERLINAVDYKSVKINYACKALTNINILRFIRTLGAGLDTVSIQEVKLGLRAGYAVKDIIYTPNCVSLEELEHAVKLGVRINIDNLSILEQFGQKYPEYPVCVRINPHIMAGGNSKIMTGHIDSKFGISIHQLPHILRIVVPYKEGGPATDIEELGEKIGEAFRNFCKDYGKDLTLMFEPGKYLVSESGSFLVNVNVIKQTTSTVFVGIDTGLNHLIRPMFYDAYHHITNLSNPEGKQRFYTVVGYICETDTFAVNRRISEVREGDVLRFHNAGAYCFSMASNYNSRYRPAEIFVVNGEAHIIRERETMEDLLARQVELDIFT